MTRELTPQWAPINKFGRAPLSNGTLADVWSYSATQAIWLAPTAARTHAIVSTSTNDISGGTGVRTLTVTGLMSWTQSAADTSETITMNGTAVVDTANQYVIIHRMVAATTGTNAGGNLGAITATASNDSTVTAHIATNQGQTQMCILGVPEGRTLQIRNIQGSLVGGAVLTDTAMSLRVNSNPETETRAFILKKEIGGEALTYSQYDADPPLTFSGPCIAKLQAQITGATATCVAGFDGYRPTAGLEFWG